MAEAGDAAVEIRRLQGAAEAGAWAHLCAEFMATSDPWETLQRSYEEGVQILTDPARETYVVTVNGELAGFAILEMTGTFVGYIKTVGVLPGWQNRGLGSRLVRFAEERILRETPNVFICVSSFNEGAQRLYERLGYQVVGELKDYIVRGHSEILFRKSVAPLREFALPGASAG